METFGTIFVLYKYIRVVKCQKYRPYKLYRPTCVQIQYSAESTKEITYD